MARVDGIELLRRIDPPPPVVTIYSAFEYYAPDEVRSLFRSIEPIAPGESDQLASRHRVAVPPGAEGREDDHDANEPSEAVQEIGSGRSA